MKQGQNWSISYILNELVYIKVTKNDSWHFSELTSALTTPQTMISAADKRIISQLSFKFN